MLELSPLVTAASASRVHDPGLFERVAVETEADHALAAPVHRETLQRPRVLVDHGHLVTLTRQDGGEFGTDPPAAHHDDSHEEHATRCADAAQLATAGPLRSTAGCWCCRASPNDGPKIQLREIEGSR